MDLGWMDREVQRIKIQEDESQASRELARRQEALSVAQWPKFWNELHRHLGQLVAVWNGKWSEPFSPHHLELTLDGNVLMVHNPTGNVLRLTRRERDMHVSCSLRGVSTTSEMAFGFIGDELGLRETKGSVRRAEDLAEHLFRRIFTLY
jgi:hypothetical protein